MDNTLLEIYLRRKNKFIVPVPQKSIPTVSQEILATGLKNFEALGYGVDAPLLTALKQLETNQFIELYTQLTSVMKKLRGAHREFKPFYPGFPNEVMNLSTAGLYFNAILHYFTGGMFRPVSGSKKLHDKLDEQPSLTALSPGTETELFGFIGTLLSGNASLSETDIADLKVLFKAVGSDVIAYFPKSIPQKENASLAIMLAVQQLPLSESEVFALASRYLTTATDVLRFAVALSGGDLSLAKPTKFKKLTRPQRRVMLALIEQAENREEDMKRWLGRWIRLGERLHPGEFTKRYPKTAEAFQKLRDDTPIVTFGTRVENALSQGDVVSALSMLLTRPGDLARRLDHLLRLDNSQVGAVLDGFAEVASKISTPVLLQVRSHFEQRSNPAPLRVFLPKGQVAKAKSIKFNLIELERSPCERVVESCELALKKRFASLPSLGTVYIDPELKDYNLPFGMRSSSKSLRTVSRGSRMSLPKVETIRLFCWWKNGKSRADIDLSAALFGPDFTYIDGIAFYNLKSQGGVHSGDIVDAPNGACEFIDLYSSILKERGIRYLVMVLNSYTVQPYIDLPECFAGWMAREEKDKGEVFEPRTVQDRLDITSDARAAIPLIIDLVESKVIWSDLALTTTPSFSNTVANNLSGITATLRGMTVLKKPDIYSLLKLHAEVRGKIVHSSEEAETIFSVESGTQYELADLASKYMI